MIVAANKEADKEADSTLVKDKIEKLGALKLEVLLLLLS
jgi:hypothetical protein